MSRLIFDREEMEKSPLYQDIVRLPKTDLHCHLDGSLRLDTVLDLIRQDNFPYPVDRDELHAELVMDDLIDAEIKSLEKYLEAFEITLSVLQTAEALERVSFELAEDAAAENVKYLEVRFAPILHTNRGLGLEEITGAVCRGLEKAEKKYDIRTGIIVCAMRHYVPCEIMDNLMRSMPYASPEEGSVIMAIQTAKHTVEMAKKDHHIVGFDLAGGEAGNPARRYTPGFFEIWNSFIPITVHAGEAVGPESIKESVHYLNAKRIGHGTNLYQDRTLMTYFKNERIPIEICITSNLQTCSELRSFEDHPLTHYLQNRLRTVICTDNRLMSNTTCSKELYLVATAFNLTMEEIKLIIAHGFNSAFYNVYHPDKPNSYDAMRELRTRVLRDLKYFEVQDAMNEKWRKKGASD
jgi:adenosine deaminase